MRGDTRAAESMLSKLGRIWSRNQRHDETALLYHAVRPRECVLPNWIEYGVHIFRHIFKFRFGVIDGHIRAELLEKILVCCRSGRDDFSTAHFRDLHRKTANATGTAVDEDCLPGLQFRDVH